MTPALSLHSAPARDVRYTPEYRCWDRMLTRCSNKNDKSYKNYGARGISVCERWHKLANFIADMGPRPSRKHTIDRIDNDGNYEPGNCRWATRLEQGSNKRTNRFLNIGGLRMTLTEASRRFSISEATVRQRLKRGWSEDEAVLPLGTVTRFLPIGRGPTGKFAPKALSA